MCQTFKLIGAGLICLTMLELIGALGLIGAGLLDR
jgi:hypothetical protein